MKHFPLYLLGLLFVTMLAFIACNDDEPERAYENSGNTNSNAILTGTTSVNNSYGKVVPVGNIIAVTEKGTDLQAVANRMEIPNLRGGNNNLFVVHTTDDYGVNYCIEWDYALRAQRWTAYRWDNSNSTSNGKRTNDWREDPLIPAEYRTTLEDHQSNGYDRGHMIGSADRLCSLEANGQTFYMSNMHPQLKGFNSNDGKSNWYNLEIRLRDRYNKASFRDTLYVVKGGTISEGNYDTAKNGLPVPHYFFMAVMRKKNSDTTQGGYAAIGFWMPHKTNSDTNFSNYAVSIDQLEKLTGLDFFCNLPDELEEQIEGNYIPSIWGL